MNRLKRPLADFTTIPNELLRDAKLSMKAKGLYCIMFSKPDGWIFFNEYLVRESNDGKDAVRAAMSELTGAGWVVRSGGGQGTGGVFRPYEYELMLHRGGKPAAEEPPRFSRGGEPASNKTDENKTEIHTTRVRRFNEFWELYPDKQARKLCEGIWARRNLNDVADQVIAGLKRWVGSDRWKRGVVMNPSTFLNQERWKDTPPAVEIKPLVKGEMRVRTPTPEEIERGVANKRAFDEFKRLSRLPENLQKSDDEIWLLVEERNGTPC